MGEHYSRNPNTSCYICGKAIYRRPKAYCSLECYGISCRRENPCIICVKPILAGDNKKTCSRACANKNRKGIKYKGSQPQSKVKSAKALRARLFSVRGEVCERCGYDKREILVVHHKDRNRFNNNMENLDLLCPNCHAEEHLLSKYWISSLVD